MTPNLVLCFGLLLSVALCASGQDRAEALSLREPVAPASAPAAAGFSLTPWQLSIGYQYSRINIGGIFDPFSTNGISASAVRYFGRAWSVEATAGFGYGYASPGLTAQSIFLRVGPRFARRTRSRLEPWVHALIGPEQFSFNSPTFAETAAAVSWSLGGGLDYRFDSGLGLRLQGDYLGSDFSGGVQRNIQFTGGVVWNFRRCPLICEFRRR